MTQDIWSMKRFEDLTAEELQDFNALVLKDIKGEANAIDLEILTANAHLWMFQLRIIRKDVEFQLASQKSKDKIKSIEMSEVEDKTEMKEYVIRQNKWRMGAVRFLTAIEHRMLYVKMIINSFEESYEIVP
ncbi:hypothetical protein EBU71_14395 [bacterium]|jgi:hypothetical protein|nr:hypothetical protein [Candidatus Elulimicrobium humile]